MVQVMEKKKLATEGLLSSEVHLQQKKKKVKRADRLQVIALEDAQHQIEASDASRLLHQTNDELFVIDTTAAGKKGKKEKDPMVWSKKYKSEKASKHESEAVKRLRASQQSRATLKKKAKRLENVWDATGAAVEKKIEVNEFVAPVVIKKQAKRVFVPSTEYQIASVELPHEGQSYNPEFEAHQDVLGQAVAEAIEKEEKEERAKQPLSRGLQEETKQFLNETSDDDMVTDDWVDDPDDGSVIFPMGRKNDKLTRTKRNKMARVQAMERGVDEHRKKTKFLKSISRVQEISNCLAKEEKKHEKNRKLTQHLKQQKLVEEQPPVRIGGQLKKLEPHTEVHLSDELGVGLRAMKPKGNVLKERFTSLHKRNMFEVGRKIHKKQKKIKMIMT